LIGMTALQNAAAETEVLLKDGTIPSATQMAFLEVELNNVLYQLKPLLDEPVEQRKVKSLSAEQVRALFERLEPMLDNINPACVDLLDEIRAVPGTGELARQIEDYDFEAAARALAGLAKSLARTDDEAGGE